MSMTDIHSEQFEELLAEALRAGPGTPAWRQAVETLQAAGQAGDDMAMLCRAREDLAAGREYRSVRAGPGFTRKLMTRLERENSRQWQLPTANIVTLLSIAIIVLVVGGSAWMVFKPSRPGSTTVDLQETYFVNALVNENFDAPEPHGFARLGLLPVACDGGMKVEVRSREGEQHVGGGFYYATGLDPAKAYELESVIGVEQADTELVTQVFISDRPEFAPGTGISPHELVCLVEAGKLRVMLSDGQGVAEAAVPAGEVAIQVRFDRESAVVELGGKTIWSGRNLLSGEAQRYVGVRYLTRGGDKSMGVTVKSLRVMAP